ncbi:MAG TPA: GNAT family N-acetyltransferase [Anaerolinea thermolimosa]|uniref:GNAT family N-acetyltransferase n=1 Tax=Anaerolinea thermolimosa TaxID=229919 RepID=A0A3D1JL97_9CHLR|nr:GNAT family N-acetyltransferase [Anaerolinea thermolimosa]
MTTPTLEGKRVRLGRMEGEKDLESWAGWFRNVEFQHLLDVEPPHLWSAGQIQTWLERKDDRSVLFGIRTLEDDALIGFVTLEALDWMTRTAWTSIGIGVEARWGQGLGREAMSLLLGYAFETLHLNRVSLTVFEYNQRAIRCYLRCGFLEEGRARLAVQRFGRRWDLVYMGFLYEDWLRLKREEPVILS